MTAPYDLWILREPRITKVEWHKLIASYPELQLPDPAFSNTPEHACRSETLTEFCWWFGTGNRLPTRIAFINGRIHVGAADSEALNFARYLANSLLADVQEG